MGSWSKFCLLMWKNWKLQMHRKSQLIMELFMPAVFTMLLILLRTLVEPTTFKEPTKYYPEKIDNLDFLRNLTRNAETAHILKKWEIAYAPQNDFLEEIMGQVSASLDVPHVSFKDAGSMEKHVTSMKAIAGVQFFVSPDKGYPKQLKYALRFPSELRSGKYTLQLNWQTNYLFPLMQMGGPRNPTKNDGGVPPGYILEGFLSIQNAIASAFINIVANDSSTKLPEIVMQRYPYPPYIFDPLLQGLDGLMPFLMLLSFVYTCKYIIKSVTEEKELQLKAAMKLMGLSNWLHWTAWFSQTFLFTAVTVSGMTILMKIKWDSKVAVLTYCHWSTLLFFLLMYSIANITFCFACSTFFKKADTAASVIGLVLFLTFMPYFLTQQKYETLTLAQKLVMSVFAASAMGYGFKLILQLEGTGEGLQWDNMWRPMNVDDEMHVGHVVMMLLLSSVLHMIIAVYVEQVLPGEFGVPEKWYFPFTKKFWCSGRNYDVIGERSRVNSITMEGFETDPVDKRVGVQIKDLRKVFNKQLAVRGLNMNLYEDEITVLLGHNGAGKTTTVFMLTGMFPPTSGTAIINGSDIRTSMNRARKSLGLCPQYNILFNDLTVKEHIIFYSRLKGVKGDEIHLEIKKYLNLLDLEDKIDTISSKLSGGMKRKLSVGVALCGGSKVVFLDEPTSGMDPTSRRFLWDLLQKEKKGRTILLSTHFMDEADVLGDRIAILSNGDLKCYGTSFFLKKKFGRGYNLICEKGDGCSSKNVTNLLRKYIPEIKVDREVGTELCYKLPEEHSTVFEEMLTDLEESSKELKLNGYGISSTNLEEVFLTVGTKQTKQSAIEENGIEDMESLSSYDGSENSRLLKGPNLICNQWRAMFSKYYLYTLRNWRLLLLQNVMPIIVIIMTIVSYRGMSGSTALRPLNINLDCYDKTATILERAPDSESNPLEKRIMNEYENLFEGYNTNKELHVTSDNFEEYILSLYDKFLIRVNSRYLVAATVKTAGVIAWFNNQALHTAPLSLNLVHNAIARTLLGSSYSIEVINSPFPFTTETSLKKLNNLNSFGFFVGVNVTFCLAVISAFYIMFIVKERITRAKLLQFVGGIRVLIFWFSTFLWDIMTFSVTAAIIVLTLACFQEEGYSTFEELGRTLLLLIIFGFAVLPPTYVVAAFVSEPVKGFIRILNVNMIFGVAGYFTISAMYLEVLDLKAIADTLTWFVMVFPHFTLAQSLNNLYIVSQTHKICDSVCDMMPGGCNKDFLCLVMPNCCSANFYSWKVPGTGRGVVYLLGAGAIFLAILLIKELRLVDPLIFRFRQIFTRTIAPKPEDGSIDEDVQKEQNRVKNMSNQEVESHTVVLDQVTKYYGQFLAVNQISVAIPHSECFGLLGVNGAGKTSTFKMLTGDERISSGEAFVRGISLKKEMNTVYQEIGYCPQFDALLEDFTGRETMHIFCLLRGIPKRNVNAVTKKLAKQLGFSEYLDKQIKTYSGGNKRKLSTAIALIGNPPVIYLDEPTTGMDPGARRQLWDMICHIRDSGQSVVLTTHSMDECEALCTRLAIMINGEFKCIGSVQHLKNRFSKGFILRIKVKKRRALMTNGVPNYFSGESIPMQRVYQSQERVFQEDIDNVKSFVEEQFPDSVLREQYQDILTFSIPFGTDTKIKWSKIFGLMEKNKRLLNVDDYSITQTTLESIFLEFAKHQREEDHREQKSRKCCGL